MKSFDFFLTCLSAKCCSAVFIKAPGNDPTSNKDGWEDFFGMFLDDGNVYKIKIDNKSKIKTNLHQ
jgi:hypothetical protein